MQRIITVFKTGISLIPSHGTVFSFLGSKFLNYDAVCRLLPTVSPMVSQSCGMKYKGRVRRRCKDCYIVFRDGRVYNMCHKFGRHKQAALQPKPLNTWILTHASQSPVRPW